MLSRRFLYDASTKGQKGNVDWHWSAKKHVYVTLPYDLTITIAQYCLGMVLFANNRQPILERVNNSPFFHMIRQSQMQTTYHQGGSSFNK